MELGSTAAEALRDNESAVSQITNVLTERLNRNMALSGTYYVGDPLLSGDVRTCRDMVDELGLQ